MGQVSGNLLSLFLVDRFGRRPLLLISQVSVALATFAMGGFFHAKHRYDIAGDYYQPDALMEDLTWVPLASLILYIVTFQMGALRLHVEFIFYAFLGKIITIILKIAGLGSLPWIMNAELSPPASLSVSSSLAASFSWLCAFVVTWAGPRIEEVIGTHGLYYSFAIFSVIGNSDISDC